MLIASRFHAFNLEGGNAYLNLHDHDADALALTLTLGNGHLVVLHQPALLSISATAITAWEGVVEVAAQGEAQGERFTLSAKQTLD